MVLDARFISDSRYEGTIPAASSFANVDGPLKSFGRRFLFVGVTPNVRFRDTGRYLSQLTTNPGKRSLSRQEAPWT